jgi:hypothetical protein
LLATGPARARIGWLELLLLLAVLVVVPLSISAFLGVAGTDRVTSFAWRVQPLGTASALAALLVARGWTSASLGGVSALVSLASAVAVGRRLRRGGQGIRETTVPAGGLVFLALGSIALVLWRGHVLSIGLTDLTTGLIALLLLFAGVGAVALAILAETATPGSSRTLRAGLGVVAAVPAIALGFAWAVAIGVAGGALLEASLIWLGLVSLRRSSSRGPWVSRVLLAASFLAALASSILGAGWALEGWLGAHTPYLPDPVPLSATIAGLGSVVAGLIGWTLLVRVSSGASGAPEMGL